MGSSNPPKVVSLLSTKIAHAPIELGCSVRFFGMSDISMNGGVGSIIRWMDTTETRSDDTYGRWLVKYNDRDIAVTPEKVVRVFRPTVVTSTSMNRSDIPTTTRSEHVQKESTAGIYMLTPNAADPNRTDCMPAAGVDAALGNAFNTGGIAYKEDDIPVATRIG